MALVELMNRDILKAVVSQNIDGLHRKSGINPDKLADVHGNTNLEICLKCSREHMRDYRVRTANKCHDHKTGRICDTPGCKGALKDTIINFGEGLVPSILQKGFEECGKSDLCLCMGTSMRVTPACNMPLEVLPNGGRMVMINLQKTPCDYAAELVIHERVDKVIKLLMKKLEIPIPDFRRSYRLKVFFTENRKKINFTGVDSNGACYTLFKKLLISGLSTSAQTYPQNARQVQPYNFDVSGPKSKDFTVECTFQGHYNEPALTLTVPMDKLKASGELEFNMVYHVGKQQFEKVEIINCNTRDCEGAAKYQVAASRRVMNAQRGSSPEVRPTAALQKQAAAASSNARGRNGAAAASAATKNGQRARSQAPASMVARKTRPSGSGKAAASAAVASNFEVARVNVNNLKNQYVNQIEETK